MAKGLCEVVGLPLASVSRLEVLAEAADLHEGFAVLDAGRGSLYVREQRRTEPAHEYLASFDEFERFAAGAPIVVAEKRTAELLDRVAPMLRELRPIDLLKPVQRCLAEGGTNVVVADANYVLPESEIYTRPRHTRKRRTRARADVDATSSSFGPPRPPIFNGCSPSPKALLMHRDGGCKPGSRFLNRLMPESQRIVLVAESVNGLRRLRCTWFSLQTTPRSKVSLSAHHGAAAASRDDSVRICWAGLALETRGMRRSRCAYPTPQRARCMSRWAFTRLAVRRAYYREPEEDALVMTDGAVGNPSPGCSKCSFLPGIIVGLWCVMGFSTGWR